MAKKKTNTGQTAKTALAIVGGGAILYMLAKKAGEAILNNITFSVGSPQIDNTFFSNGFFRVDVPVTIENRNPFPLGIEYFRGVVSYGEVTLTQVNIPAGFSIPSQGVQTIILDMDIPVQQVLSDITVLINQGNIFSALLNKFILNGELQVRGNLTRVPIPINNVSIPIVP